MFKRKALIVGYDAADHPYETTLYSIEDDINKYKKYLMSPKGGAWEDKDEIEVFNNVPLSFLMDIRENIKDEKPDVALIIVTGHGSYSQKCRCRKFQLNKHETVCEQNLVGIAPKEIFIWDSCSNIVSESIQISEKLIDIEVDKILKEEVYEKAKKIYEHKCSLCKPQCTRLYASKIDTSAQDIDGGVYTSALLEVAEKNSEIDIYNAHFKAKKIVENITARSEYGIQEPSIMFDRSIKQFLPWAINVESNRV